jgi:hypothetical protein
MSLALVGGLTANKGQRARVDVIQSDDERSPPSLRTDLRPHTHRLSPLPFLPPAPSLRQPILLAGGSVCHRTLPLGGRRRHQPRHPISTTRSCSALTAWPPRLRAPRPRVPAPLGSRPAGRRRRPRLGPRVEPHDEQRPAASVTAPGSGNPWTSPGDVAATDATVGVRPQLPLELHQAPDLSAVDPNIRLEVGGRRLDGVQVDTEQLRALSGGAAIGRPKAGSC